MAADRRDRLAVAGCHDDANDDSVVVVLDGGGVSATV